MAEEFRLPYGTAPYMAPEQVFGIRTDPRSDLFALGCLMYFFATGRRPFGDPQSLKGLKKRLWWDPTPPRALNPKVPPWLQELILRCLAPDPAARHPTAAQLAFELGHPDQVKLTHRAEKLKRDAWSDRIKRKYHPAAFRPTPRRDAATESKIAAAPIVAVAVDLAESHKELSDAIRVTVQRIMSTVPDARLAVLNVRKQNLISIDNSLDDEGRSIHVQKAGGAKRLGATDRNAARAREFPRARSARCRRGAARLCADEPCRPHGTRRAYQFAVAEHPWQCVSGDRAECTVHCDGRPEAPRLRGGDRSDVWRRQDVKAARFHRPQTPLLRKQFLMPLQCNGGGSIGFLALDAPIAQFAECDDVTGDGAAHEIAAGRQHLELTVEVADFRFALEAKNAFNAVHWKWPALSV